MNTTKTIAFLIFLLGSQVIFAQYKGYFGKKNLLTFSVDYSRRLESLHSGLPDLYEDNRFMLEERRNRIDFGFSYKYIAKPRFATGIEVNYNQFEPAAVRSVYYANYQFPGVVRLESPSIDVLTIVPSFDFTTRGQLAPLGVSHGLGIEFMHFRINTNRQYHYQLKDLDDVVKTYKTNNLLAEGASTKSTQLGFRYSLNFSAPISRFMLFQFSPVFRVPLMRFYERGFGVFEPENNNEEFFKEDDILFMYTQRQLANAIRKEGLLQFFSIKAGFIFAL